MRIYIPERAETSLHLTAPSEELAGEWVKILREVVESGYGKRFKLTKVLEVGDYQAREFVLEEQFVRECNSGDLLLFKANHTFAKMQRAITFSEYGNEWVR